MLALTLNMHLLADFMRLGSLKKINPRLLPYSLHARQEKGVGDAMSEVKQMLNQCTSAAEADMLQQELARVSAQSFTFHSSIASPIAVLL